MGPVVIWRQRSDYGFCLNRGTPILPIANLGAYERSVRVPASIYHEDHEGHEVLLG
jgi:hypothetical protein